MIRHLHTSRGASYLVAALAVVAVLATLPAAEANAELMNQLAALRDTAVNSYNARDWSPAAQAADAYVAALEDGDLPKAGADYAVVSFLGAHARFELWKANPESFPYDFEADVVDAMEDSLRILQDDPFFKHNLLGTVLYEKLESEHFDNLELENAASWHLYKALMTRYEELAETPRDTPEYEAFAKYVLVYINRCFEMARRSPVPDIYLLRVREAARMGFGSKFDARFAQLFEVVGFDGGNAKAGILWQTALDMMNSDGGDPDQILETFSLAAAETRGQQQRAEVYRQMADYSSRQDGHDYKLKAVEYGRMAFRLDPSNHDIQVQYGTSLHVVSYAHYVSGRYDDALDTALEATSFEWEGDELAYFDLSRSQANFGDKINALTHAERAYEKARRKFEGEDLQPYRQNYINILRQFGLSARADQIEATSEEAPQDQGS